MTLAEEMDRLAVDWDRAEAEEALSKGDLTHIIIRRDGGVSVNRASSWADERLPVTHVQVGDTIRQASRCKPGRRAGVEVRQLAGKDALPSVVESRRPKRFEM